MDKSYEMLESLHVRLLLLERKISDDCIKEELRSITHDIYTLRDTAFQEGMALCLDSISSSR